jgi:hypothetical protein
MNEGQIPKSDTTKNIEKSIANVNSQIEKNEQLGENLKKEREEIIQSVKNLGLSEKETEKLLNGEKLPDENKKNEDIISQDVNSKKTDELKKGEVPRAEKIPKPKEEMVNDLEEETWTEEDEKKLKDLLILIESTKDKIKEIDDEIEKAKIEENKLNKPETIIIENNQEITVINEPKQIIIEEIINENVSAQEREEIQKEFPGQNIEKVIENQVIEEINDKTIVPVEKRTKDNLLKRMARKIKIGLLAIFVSAGVFESATILKTSESAEVLSYNNIKVENLKDWENVKLYEDEINKLENISIITKAHENSNDRFIIIDKQNGKAHQYQGDSLIKSYNVCLGKDTIGDEQTKLKSIYRKKFKDSEEVFHRRPEVPLDEATYVENGERYIRDGYEAYTEWGGGNMKTGAGIYTISNKGPFLGDFGIFLKNERGIQVATSLHVNRDLKTESPNFRFTNGCIGFSEKDLIELYKTVSNKEKVYILPDNPHNKYQIIDGELRFLSNQKDVNKTIRPYKPKPIILKAENINKTGKVFLTSIAENKEKLMSLYPTISNDVYNELAKIAYGILGQESTFGTYGKARGQFGRIRDVGASVVGFEPSVGPCQVRLENIDKKVKDAFNIKKNNDLFDTKTNAIAAMSILLDNYLYVSYNGKEDEYKKLVILKYNAPLEAKRIIKENKKFGESGPKARSYIKKVLNYSKLASVYTTNANENYYNPNWNYAQLINGK